MLYFYQTFIFLLGHLYFFLHFFPRLWRTFLRNTLYLVVSGDGGNCGGKDGDIENNDDAMATATNMKTYVGDDDEDAFVAEDGRNGMIRS